MKNYQVLYDFIEIAVKNRNYPPNTASGLKAALGLFEKSLNSDELNSYELFKERLETIYKEVCSKNAKTYSAGSLAAYKSRIVKVIDDYEKWGIDPSKMANWPLKEIIPRAKRQTRNSGGTERDSEQTDVGGASPSLTGSSVAMHKIELHLREGVKFTLILPHDINPSEANMVKAIIDSLIKKD